MPLLGDQPSLDTGLGFSSSSGLRLPPLHPGYPPPAFTAMRFLNNAGST